MRFFSAARVRRHLSLLFAGLASISVHAASPYVWRNAVIGGGGFVSGLVYHPTQPGLLYARTDVGGAFRWLPDQQRWLPLNDDLGADDAELLGIVSLALDPHDAQRVYLAGGSYLQSEGAPAVLFASTNQGASWRRTPLPFHLGGNADGRNTGERLQVDPHDGAILLLGTNRDGLWRSGDHGEHWARVASFGAASVTLVLFDARDVGPTEPCRTIYVGVDTLEGPSLLRSRDGGTTWTAVAGEPTHLIPHHAALAADGTLYVTYGNYRGPNDVTTGAVWKLQTDVDRWTDITPLVPNPATDDTLGYAGLALDPKHPGTVIVSTLDRWIHRDEVFRSVDGGATWKPLLAGARWDHSFAPYTEKLTPHWIGTVAIDPFQPSTAWFGTGFGLWRSDNANATDAGRITAWTFADAGLEETVPLGLASPPQGAHLLSAIGDIGGFRHETLDRSPDAAFAPAYTTNECVAFAAEVPTKIVRTHSGPTRGAVSVDGGITWKDFATAPAEAASGPGNVAISCDGRRIVWVPRHATTYVSADDGATWHRSTGGPMAPRDFRRLVPAADSRNPDTFYLYEFATGRVYVSRDGGERFVVAAELPPLGGPIAVGPGRAGELWAPTPAGLFRSTEAGKRFARVEGLDAADRIGFGAPAPGRDTPAVFVHGKKDHVEGVFRSDDGGRSWVGVSDKRHNFGYLHAIAGDPRIFGRVYLATGGRGIVYGDPAPMGETPNATPPHLQTK